MLKFNSFLEILNCADQVIDISPGNNHGNAIVTFANNTVFVVSVQNKEILRYWSFTTNLTNKAVYDKNIQSYVVVCNYHEIQIWNDEMTNPNECKKIKSAKRIVDLISYDKESTVVLYADGSHESLSSAIEVQRMNGVNTKEVDIYMSRTKLKDAKITKVGSNYFLTYIREKKKKDGPELIWTPLYSETSKSFALTRHIPGIKLSGYILSGKQKTLQLLTIWSDGRLFEYQIEQTTDETQSPGKYIKNFTHLRLDKPIALVTLDKDLVAMYGSRNIHEGASLILYNTKYNLVRAQLLFKVYFESSRAWALHNYILLSVGCSLYAASCYIKVESLADLIGVDVQAGDHNIILNKTCTDEEAFDESDEIQMNINLEKIMPTALSNVQYPSADGNSLAYLKASGFDMALKSLCEYDMELKVVREGNVSAVPNVRLLKSSESTQYLYKILEECHEYLQRIGASEEEISEKIIAIIEKGNLFEDTITCMRRYTQYSECTLIRTLNYVIEQKLSLSEESVKPQRKKRKKSRSSIGVNCDSFLIAQTLIALMKHRFDKVEILPHLRNMLNTEKVLYLLEFLYKQLTSCDEESIDNSEITEEKEKEEAINPIDGIIGLEMQLIKWFEVLITAHSQSLITTTDPKISIILKKWDLYLRKFKGNLCELGQLAATYEELLKCDHKKNTKFSNWYNIFDIVFTKRPTS